MLRMKKWVGRFARRAMVVSIITLAPTVSMAAVPVTIDGTTYEIDLYTGSFSDNETVLESQPWFGNDELAESIITTYYAEEGDIITNAFDSTYLDFAFSRNGDNLLVRYAVNDGAPVAAASTLSGSGFAVATSVTTGGAASVPEINGGVLFQAFLILFSAWLVMRNAPFRLRFPGLRFDAPSSGSAFLTNANSSHRPSRAL